MNRDSIMVDVLQSLKAKMMMEKNERERWKRVKQPKAEILWSKQSTEAQGCSTDYMGKERCGSYPKLNLVY